MAKKKLKEPTSYITPYLLYKDVGSALSFLKKAFGFSEYGSRFKDKEGIVRQHIRKVSNAEMQKAAREQRG